MAGVSDANGEFCITEVGQYGGVSITEVGQYGVVSITEVGQYYLPRLPQQADSPLNRDAVLQR